jgi:two-component system, NarL family, sensor kinase
VRSSVAAALGLAKKGLEEARRSVLDLRPAPLEGRTLAEALAALAAEADEPGGPAVTFAMRPARRSRATKKTPVATPAIPPIPPAIEAGLYRIAQEALQNALRHAGATRITLRLQVTSRSVRLTLDDDGRGFAVEDVPAERPAGRFGLVGMRERARLLGGSLQVESLERLGTRIVAEVPLAHA